MKKIAFSLFIVFICGTINSLKAQKKMKITIGNKEFTATLNDSEAAQEFIKLLPLEITMSEHNSNEKYYNLPKRLPGTASNPGTVQSGDLMIWSSNTLVLFYAPSRTSYSYIPIGKIDNAAGLSRAVGRVSVSVKYELEKQHDRK